MIKFELIRTLLLVSFILVLDANAEGEKITCDDSYSVCVEKCDSMQSPLETCYNLCDTTYSKCLESEQYTEVEENSQPEEK